MNEKHTHHGKTSEMFLNTDEILNKLNLQDNEIFMDAGCGDGHIAIQAAKRLNNATIYAVDIWEPSINELKSKIQEENLSNVKPVLSSISELDNISDNTIDTILMVNVFHGFLKNNEETKLINELKRILKPHGKLAIIEFQKKLSHHGPDIDTRISEEKLNEIMVSRNMSLVSLDSEIGTDVDEGYSHYLAIFENNI